MFQIGLKNILLLKKLKMLFRGHTLFVILMVKKLFEHFTKKNWKRQTKKNLEQKNLLKENVINYISNEKVLIIHLINGLIKKILVHRNDLFSTLW